ncbi:MAG: hypothetical protein KIT24_04175 [Phycisphaeraceae bacterium]|nr:hypothetical protein [Phycisphaeraceae bacterium]
MNDHAPPTAHRQTRRGAAVAAVVVLLGMLNLVIIGGADPARDDSVMVLERLQAARSLHAAESGIRIVLRLTLSGQPLPAEGSTLALPGATVEFIQVPSGGTGEIVVQGRSGPCRRTLSAIVH